MDNNDLLRLIEKQQKQINQLIENVNQNNKSLIEGIDAVFKQTQNNHLVIYRDKRMLYVLLEAVNQLSEGDVVAKMEEILAEYEGDTDIAEADLSMKYEHLILTPGEKLEQEEFDFLYQLKKDLEDQDDPKVD